jgi:maleate isomerase
LEEGGVPDKLGFRRVIGVVIPSVNTAAQPEFESMRPRGVTNQTARIMTPLIALTDQGSFLQHVHNMQRGLIDAVDQIVTCAPDHLIMGLSLETFWGGVRASEDLLRTLEGRTGVRVSMGSNAILEGLRVLGAGKRVGLLAPHPPLGNEKVCAFFTEAGYTVARLHAIPFKNGLEYARVTDAQLRDALASLDGPDVDAIVQVGTNLPMSAFAAQAEVWLGKPVVAINAAIYWHALRACGIPDAVDGFGSLLARH